jgi:hypothetical protein
VKTFLVGCVLVMGAFAAENTLSKREAAEGWKLLFDGKSMNGWEMNWAKDWKVQDGALSCDASERSWLNTTGTYSNYVLKLEFRGTAKVNSGVFLRSEKEGQPHITGYELQIWDYQPAGYLTGSLVGSLKASPTKILGDQWNKYEITADGDHFLIVLNGTTLLDGHDSKHSAGVIGFQCQPENPIAFRNVKLRVISR